MADVFLSYARDDIDTMRRLRADLQAANLTVWTDEGLEPGVPSWRRAIEEAIEGAGSMVVLLSPPAKDSRWVNRDIAYAQVKKLHIFPVLAGGGASDSIPLALISSQYVDLQSEYDRGVNNLVIAITRHLDVAQETDDVSLREPEASTDSRSTTIDRIRLRRLLSEHFSSSELAELTYDLGLDYPDLAGSGKAAKIIELITYFERRGRYDELVQAARESRPDVDW